MGEARLNRLTSDAIGVIDAAVTAGALSVVPLLSGGHDSICACHIASQHPMFEGMVHHIDTGIGARRTREFVNDLCAEMGWKLRVYHSPETYEKYVQRNGFPGPGGHRFVYAWLKERCIRQIVRERTGGVGLLTGVRSDESERRMGCVDPVKVGEFSRKTGKLRERRRVWIAPCHNWTVDDQRAYMDAHALPHNPIKLSPIGMSGECFCGAFARPNELQMIREIAPDVAEEIDRLSIIAEANGKHAKWGARQKRRDRRQMEIAWSGPLCSSCDRRATAGGFAITGGRP